MEHVLPIVKSSAVLLNYAIRIRGVGLEDNLKTM